MKIINKIFLILIICTNVTVFSQTTIPLYKLVMNSDIIIESSEASHITKPFTEYYSQTTIEFKSINNILKNNYNDKLINIKYILNKEGEDYYNHLSGESCSGVGFALLPDTKYYHFFFIKRIEKKYYVIGQLWYDVNEKDFLFISESIKKINEIGKIKNYNEKYIKTIDWYLESNRNGSKYKIENVFTSQFIDYYKLKGVLKDGLTLDENQKIKAKELFLEGNEDLYELIKNDFTKETDEYYLSQLYKIKAIADKSYSEYSDFQSKATIFLERKEDVKIKFINETLTSGIESYEKNNAIDLILEFIESNIYKN